MTERPILFSGAMVRAILAGTKTVTRRLVRLPCARGVLSKDGWRRWDPERADDRESMAFGSWVYGRPGDRLWVRETWGDGSKFYPHSTTLYRADYSGALAGPPVAACRSSAETAQVLGRPHQPREGCCCEFRWRPSIHMLRWASRLTLEVVSVRVERLQDISDADAVAEGVGPEQYVDRCMDLDAFPRGRFQLLWDSINGKRASWASNPWIWRVEFKRLETP